MPVPAVTTSAAGSLSLLEDEDKDVRVYALEHLVSIVPQFWAEISDRLSWLELLADDMANELPAAARPQAALLISKVYFYMGILDDAVDFALSAGAAFQQEPEGEYRETIIAGCLDSAIRQTANGDKLDPRLSAIVDSVLRSSTSENGKLAVGLALSLRRLDLIEMLYLSSRAPPTASTSASNRPVHDESLLRYVLSEVVSGSGNDGISPEFRDSLFALLLRLFSLSPSPDYNAITTIWIQSNNPKGCGEALIKLLDEGNTPEAYQIAFDVAEGSTQGFVEEVRKVLEAAGLGTEEEKKDEKKDDSQVQQPRTVLNDILRGIKSAELFLNFLNKNNKTDMTMLNTTRGSLEDRYSIYHTAITFTNAFANCGTTSDQFLRENLEWLGRSSNWAKFSTTAALGLIHRGSWVNGMSVVQPYLPGGTAPSSYSEGGALFALGLIYTGRKEGCEDELRRGIAEGNDPIVQHGAALGLGVSGIATADEEIYDEIRTALFQDNATAGEAAGYAMGLIMLGTASDRAVDEMLSYARETQHEKIIRSLAVGVALVLYGTREAADPTIELLMKEKDAILRYGAMFSIALAYAGTGNNKAIRKLLHVAVSDVSDDVRRAAVTALGFVLFRNHTQVPRVVQLLAESYNPHVRHGATLALGISCAGTGLEAAIELLEPMTRDPVDFVRQGAFISLAMVLIQQSEAQQPKVASIRDKFAKVVADKREDPMARFGASLAQGIIDAGGRNMTLSLSTRAGTLNMNAVVGMTLFVQFWYWFPLASGLGLAFSPTAVIGVDSELRVPNIDLVCNAKPSTFAYPSAVKKDVKEKEKKVKPAQLSTTAKARAREKTKKEEKGEAMDEDDKEDEKEVGAGEFTGEPLRTAAKRKAEQTSFTIGNMTRVTPQQLSTLSFPAGGKYVALRPIGQGASSSTSSSSSTDDGEEKRKATGVAAIFGGGERNESAGASSSTRSTGGSIVLLRDVEPEKEGTFIELNQALWPDPPARTEAAAAAQETAGAAGAGAGAGVEAASAGGAPSITEPEGGEADAPPPFEYPFDE